MTRRDRAIRYHQRVVEEGVQALHAGIQSLATLGYNEHYASTLPGRRDSTGTTSARYAREARKIRRRMMAAASRLSALLDSIDPCECAKKGCV